MKLFNGDCLEVMKDISDNSIDIIIADPPFSRFKHLSWDKIINFEKLWEQLWRIAKPNCPIFLFGDFKFAVEIYNSQPKYFKYEIVWNKGQTTTPLLSRKRFGKCTEYILAFYKKQPVYNYLKYHKITETKNLKKFNGLNHRGNQPKKNSTSNKYKPALPLNIIENEVVLSSMVMGKKNKMYHSKSGIYDPRLPLNIIDEKEIIESELYDMTFKRSKELYEPRLPTNVIKCKIKRANKTIKCLTEKPQHILEHLLKYFSNEGDTCLDFCMGSGSLGVACNKLGRNFIGIEKNEEFYQITKKRLENLDKTIV